MKHVTAKHLQLTETEISNFINNAQHAIMEHVSPDSIKALYFYKRQIVKLFEESKFTKLELAAVLISAAWDIFEKDSK